MKFLLFITMAVVFAYPTNGQTCNCESNFEWVKKTFEENDAGFQYIIDKKGEAAYNIHNQLMMEKAKDAKTLGECTVLLYEWLKFFRSRHIGIEPMVYIALTPQSGSQLADKTTAREKRKIDIKKFEKYINAKKEVDYEGIWKAGNYKIGIQKEGTNYIGFIIEADVDGWREPGQIKLKIEQNDGKVKSTYYMRDHSPVKSGDPELIGKNYLQIGQQLLERLSPVFTEDVLVENYFKSVNSENPYLDELNATTLYLRIPSFDVEQKPAIDKVLTDNKSKILKTDNLIIDLRNNGGGGDRSFYELIPFLYTNPIRTISVEFLSTPQNNKRMLEWSADTNLSESARQWYKNVYNKLQERLGEFIFVFNTPIDIEQQDTVYEYPKNVGIIINEGCASTTEQLLLAAKQSKKVKLFGVTTSGALDISNMHSILSPCKEFKLWYCLSRSMRIPNMVIDDIGLQPDYYLDKSILPYKWVEFVNEILNQ
jgi:hypothetical protein